jgi:hypothetical protein
MPGELRRLSRKSLTIGADRVTPRQVRGEPACGHKYVRPSACLAAFNPGNADRRPAHEQEQLPGCVGACSRRSSLGIDPPRQGRPHGAKWKAVRPYRLRSPSLPHWSHAIAPGAVFIPIGRRRVFAGRTGCGVDVAALLPAGDTIGAGDEATVGGSCDSRLTPLQRSP